MSEVHATNDSICSRATGTITAVLGITFAIAGMHHGLFETLQGYSSTGSPFIPSIGPAQQMWEHGTDEAFTVIPNFLITGIAAVVVSVAIVLGSLFLVRSLPSVVRGPRFGVLRKSWPTVFLLLFLSLTLVGGGIGHIIFFLTAWGYATRMNKPMKWWRKTLSGNFGKIISAGWVYSLSFTSFCFIVALEISVFGFVPGMSNPDSILAVCWGFLLLALIFTNVTFISGLAYDIEKQTNAVN